MEIIFTLIALWVAWILFKGKYQRDQIREALDDIRITAIQAPFRFMMNNEREQFFDIWPWLNEEEKNEFVTKMIILGLASQGLEIRHIPVNIRLGNHFQRTVLDVKQSLNHMAALQNN